MLDHPVRVLSDRLSAITLMLMQKGKLRSSVGGKHRYALTLANSVPTVFNDSVGPITQYIIVLETGPLSMSDRSIQDRAMGVMHMIERVSNILHLAPFTVPILDHLRATGAAISNMLNLMARMGNADVKQRLSALNPDELHMYLTYVPRNAATAYSYIGRMRDPGESAAPKENHVICAVAALYVRLYLQFKLAYTFFDPMHITVLETRSRAHGSVPCVLFSNIRAERMIPVADLEFEDVTKNADLEKPITRVVFRRVLMDIFKRDTTSDLRKFLHNLGADFYECGHIVAKHAFHWRKTTGEASTLPHYNSHVPAAAALPAPNRRCPRGTRRNKRTGACEATAVAAVSAKAPRCPRGTRRNKRTGACEPRR